MNTPKITKLRHSAPFGAVRSRLEGRVFHVSRLSNLDPILTSGEIRPNQDATFATTFGSSSNSFFRNRGCVEAYPVDSGLSRCSMLSNRIGAVARVGTDGEGAVACRIQEVVFR